MMYTIFILKANQSGPEWDLLQVKQQIGNSKVVSKVSTRTIFLNVLASYFISKKK